ncbi:MAG: aminopeptidase P family protein [Spirochaetaceae bacterium]|nr:MAG: aminopeptidase P family protein [Spirochaetaceae bacterium]
MNNTILQRISALRQAMRRSRLDAYIVPGTDAHQSEYLADHWQVRAWISGFTGSAGNVVVTADDAGLWTDARYYLEAAAALEGTGIRLHKLGMPDVGDYPQWLANTIPAGGRVGADARLLSVSAFRSLRELLQHNGAEIVAGEDLIDAIWHDRPPLPSGRAFLLEDRFSGKPRTEKLLQLRDTLKKQGATHCLISTLDDIAWLLNLRGSDIPYNPLLMAYALLTPEALLLCVDGNKLSREDREALLADNVVIEPYDTIEHHLRRLHGGSTIAIDPARTSMRLFSVVERSCRRIEQPQVTTAWKAVKNRTEQEHICRCMIRDGVALERFFHWLDSAVGSPELSELSVVQRLHEFRAAGDRFMGESFRTIAGFADHGAIIHYTVTPHTEHRIEPHNLLLIDCGAHYLDGTTDVTRVVPIGVPTAEQRRDFTLVLKAHIALATVRFPERSSGAQLDPIARSVLWRNLRDYGHGTGHGVGFFLNVHEGPQRIAAERADTELLPGMLTSNEPGLYRPGRYGIRIENLVLTQPAEQNEFGRFLRFETVTLCHIDRRLIEAELLTAAERDWLNAYHQRVFRTLGPQLEQPVKRWLADRTAPL